MLYQGVTYCIFNQLILLCPQFTNHNEGLSVLQQVIFALGVAEVSLEFEHRDLHIGNVLVRRCSEEKISMTLLGHETEIVSSGVFATIIDFTISRLKKGEKNYKSYYNLFHYEAYITLWS